LTLLSMGRKSGTLSLTSHQRLASVVFVNGAVVYAGSNQEQLRLSAILLRKKKITREQFDAMDALVRDGKQFGQIALQQGVLNEDQLRDFLKIQVADVLFDAFVWTTGEFSFAEELDLPEYAVTITVDLPNLIMEGARRIEEWEHCLQLLPDSSTVYRVVASPRDDKITLTQDEWKLLFMINGQRTLDDLVRDSDEDQLNVYRIVYGLAANQLIEPVRSGSPQRIGGSGPPDDTMRQTAPVFHTEPTVRDGEVSDDTSLLITSDEKRLMAQLLIAGEPEARKVSLMDTEYLLGRHRDNNIQINDLGVSGFHARIFRSGDGYAIEDLKSRNGIWINGTRVFHATLRNGDTVRFGATDVKYEVVELN
ncbi:MAG: DUF4388 domain-containing protein, partial [Thermoanaerobaculia bacterium]